MPGLKEVRIRIGSVKSTQQITNAMRMVAASKLRRAQTAILKLRPYAAKLNEIMQNLSASSDASGSVYTEHRKPERILLVVFTSNRGLCGAFNSNIIKAAHLLVSEKYADQNARQQLEMITVGRKATEFFRKRKFSVRDSWDEIFDHLTYDQVSPYADRLMQAFANREYDRIVLVYNQFKNAATQRLVEEQFLPVVPPEVPASGKKAPADYIYEPDQETLLHELLPKSLRIQFHKAALDSFASEQGARMTAMQQATDNAREILRELQISYNKARQGAITKELLEIVAGAEALKG